MKLLKSTGAIAGGLAIGLSLTLLFDFAAGVLGLINMDNFNDNGHLQVMLVILYRFACNSAGCYFAARFAPEKPMRHAIALASIGLAFSIAGGWAKWAQAPAYYNIALIALAIPSGIIGGWWYMRSAGK